MKLKEIELKYEIVELLEEKESLNLLSPPQRLAQKTAIDRYGDRKVLYHIEHDDAKVSEVLVENLEQYRKRQETNSI